jgi:hypothetical protein
MSKGGISVRLIDVAMVITFGFMVSNDIKSCAQKRGER